MNIKQSNLGKKGRRPETTRRQDFGENLVDNFGVVEVLVAFSVLQVQCDITLVVKIQVVVALVPIDPPLRLLNLSLFAAPHCLPAEVKSGILAVITGRNYPCTAKHGHFRRPRSRHAQ